AWQIHDSGDAQFGVSDIGFLGAAANVPGGPGHVFGGTNGIFEGQLIVGLSETQVCGEAYAGSTGQEPLNWANPSAFTTLTAPFDAPYDAFDEGYEVSFDCSAEPEGPLPIAVTERSYSLTGEGYIVLQFDVTNTGGSPLDDVYIGVFTDYDVGDYIQNLAEFDDGLNLLYVYDNSGSAPQHFGMMILNATENGTPVSGYHFDVGDGFNPTEALMYAALHNGGGAPPAGPEDRRTVIGTGPYTIGAGETQSIQVAYVAANTEIGLMNAAQEVEELVGGLVAIEPGPDGTPGTHALSQPAPNPSAGRSALTLEVAQAQPVRVAVYDALGREVAVLHDGTLAAGQQHRLDLDASALPSGVYVVRVVGQHFTDTRMVSVAR